MKLGYIHFKSKNKGEPSPFGYNLLNILFLSSLKRNYGFERIQKLYTWKLDSKKNLFFKSFSMNLINQFGITETTAAPTFDESE